MKLQGQVTPATTAFIAAHPQDYAVAYLPTYASELNPEEQCNAVVKRTMVSGKVTTSGAACCDG
ncbi:hypothetical protein JQC81_32040 [Microvirga arabica]|uniref:transposase n=1 Tax=Microvirga arabica TaxID=1128671 RepID=UPI00193A2769|nr:hypothetical protein [Microvirga arabica]